MKKLIPLLFLSLPALADKVLVASCSEGSGCTFSLSDVDTDMGQSFGGVYENLKPESILIFGKKKNGEEITYVEDHRTRTQIDRQWGGDGYTQIYLFDPVIQPADGTWKAEYGTATGNECYGIGNVGTYMGRFIQKGLSGSGNITFRKPFSPAQLFPATQMKWRQTGYGRYAGVIDFGSNELAGFKLYYTIHVVSRKKIVTNYTMTMKIPTKGQCNGSVPITFTFLKGNDDAPDFPEEEDDLLPVKSKGKEDDLLPVKSRGEKDDLLPVKPGQPKVDRLNDADDDLRPVKPKEKQDDLLPVKPGQPKADRLNEADDDLLPVKSKNKNS